MGFRGGRQGGGTSAGNDIIQASDGNDTITGGTGNNTCANTEHVTSCT